MNIWKIIYLNSGKRFEDIDDHRSYTELLSSCEIKANVKDIANEYMKDHILELRRKILIYDWSSQLYNCDEQPYIHIFLRSSNIWSFTYSFPFFTFYGYITNSQCDQLRDGLIAQLVEHCNGFAEVMGSNPVQAWIFFRLLLCITVMINHIFVRDTTALIFKHLESSTVRRCACSLDNLAIIDQATSRFALKV